jgi:putative endonuclease
MYYVYLLQEEKSNKHYIGYTSDLRRRMKQHQSKHPGYTGSGNWRLIYYESYLSKEDAQVRERKLKQDGRSRRYMMEQTKHSQLNCFNEDEN